MHDDHALIEARLRRALSRVERAGYGDRAPLEVAVWAVDSEPVPVAAALAAKYVPARVGDRWGPPWATAWFRITGTVPAGWAGRRVEALIDIGFRAPEFTGFHAEGLVYGRDGSPVKGLNPQTSGYRSRRAKTSSCTSRPRPTR